LISKTPLVKNGYRPVLNAQPFGGLNSITAIDIFPSFAPSMQSKELNDTFPIEFDGSTATENFLVTEQSDSEEIPVFLQSTESFMTSLNLVLTLEQETTECSRLAIIDDGHRSLEFGVADSWIFGNTQGSSVDCFTDTTHAVCPTPAPFNALGFSTAVVPSELWI
jgi:hypothetical protein